MNRNDSAPWRVIKPEGEMTPVQAFEVMKEDLDRLDRMMDELWEKVNDWHEKLS